MEPNTLTHLGTVGCICYIFVLERMTLGNCSIELEMRVFYFFLETSLELAKFLYNKNYETIVRVGFLVFFLFNLTLKSYRDQWTKIDKLNFLTMKTNMN